MKPRTETAMGTMVTIHAVPNGAEAQEAVQRAFGWFHEVEARCTRFNKESELMQLCAHPGEAVEASAIVYEVVRFALMVAEESGGAFDPSGGQFRDIELDDDEQTITLLKPLQLDLGAVAKGMAVDLAARELAELRDFAIDAGGDQYFGGRNPRGEKWTVGIRHPRIDGELIGKRRVSDQAVCTSGDYERGQHIQDPLRKSPAQSAASVTVIAPTAMLADALATAAFVMGHEEGVPFLRRMGVEGLFVTPDLEQYAF